MKKETRDNLVFAIVISLALLFISVPLEGCKSSAQKTVFQTTATTSVSVEAALREYNALAKAGKTTIAQNRQVKAAYLKYQAAFAVVCDAGQVYAAAAKSGDPAPAAAALQEAVKNSAQTITDIINLVGSFGVTFK